MTKAEIEKSFIETIRQNERIIYKVCSFYVSKEFPIEDLYQETIHNLWSAYPKFRHECSVTTWIYRVALNTCISGMRKEMRRPKTDIDIDNLPETLFEQEGIEEDIHEMYNLINRLKTMEKVVILLYLEEKSYQEIADITGLSVSNVATKLKRSKRKLKEMSNF